MKPPLCIELFAGLHGWGEGFVSEGYRVVGFDIVDMCAALGIPRPAGCSLVPQDVLTLHGSQFRNAAVIVCSPPCQRYSYMAMPWTRAKALAAWYRDPGFIDERLADLNALFDACFRIQREACEAAGRHIPLIVENVKGAQPWVGRAKANFGSFYLWGDIHSVGGGIVAGGLSFGNILPKPKRGMKFNPDGTEHGQGSWFKIADSKNRGAQKNNGGSWFGIGSPGQKEVGQNPVNGVKVGGLSHGTFPGGGLAQGHIDGTKQGGNWWHDPESMTRRHSSKSPGRKAASAMIAKIPEPLARHIARVFKPQEAAA